MFDLANPIYQNPEAAREHLETIQWPHGPVCPHCGNVDAARITKLAGKSTRPGVYKCKECRKPFSVTVGTVFERSHIPLHKWVAATHLMAASKKGISAHQMHRMLGVTYKTAWFMEHRIRAAMAVPAKGRGPMGGEGKTIEADETYWGPKDDQTPPPRKAAEGPRTTKPKPGFYKRTIVSLVERGGEVRSFHVEAANIQTVKDVLFRNVDRKSTLYTDQAQFYKKPGKDFDTHRSVNHSKDEWVRWEGEAKVHTNTIENVFSVFKRGMKGTYQHCGEAHLHRYLAEFDFRYNRRSALGVEDNERHDMLLAAIRGKRLTYRRIGEASLV
ncbi:IS1595 family transposase [Devosia neptuniae]|jgi:transposase-like protein|uniref:IS1595 family transposase n=1 Tax=Devosia TaxID=46913 RepID=UPI0022B07F36|nr:IS1595 family transposase [Devosia neptuniae]MCZ4345766.1 IS1595 family transposase [Devosia neptuniae]|tara:strand:- start:67040 stop:68023 length:984 start_codon:yes stop_codon:yes gene_type:complete